MAIELSDPTVFVRPDRLLASGEKVSLSVAEISAEIRALQARALYTFYESTRMMESSSYHNWVFEGDQDSQFCNFTGVECDTDDFVVAIELASIGLSGNLPDNFDHLFKVCVGNCHGFLWTHILS